MIARVAELLAHEEGDRSLATWNSIGRQVVVAKNVVRDVAEVESAVTAYYSLLERTGVREDHVVANVRRPGATLRALGVIAILPFAIVGFIVYAIPYQLPKLAGRLAGSERDVISTYKLGLGLAAHLVWMNASVIAVRTWWIAPLLFACGISALIWLDRSELLTARWRSRKNAEPLRSARSAAIAAIARARQQLE